MTQIFIKLLLLCAGHAVCDYPLQGDFLARAKNHRAQQCSCGKTVVRLRKCPAEFWACGPEVCSDGHWHKGIVVMPWWQALFAHAAIHAGMVLLITGSLWIALAELACHMVIDWLKCDGRIGFSTDQALHYAFKILWAVL
jgi:hypothetical protein